MRPIRATRRALGCLAVLLIASACSDAQDQQAVEAEQLPEAVAPPSPAPIPTVEPTAEPVPIISEWPNPYTSDPEADLTFLRWAIDQTINHPLTSHRYEVIRTKPDRLELHHRWSGNFDDDAFSGDATYSRSLDGPTAVVGDAEEEELAGSLVVVEGIEWSLVPTEAGEQWLGGISAVDPLVAPSAYEFASIDPQLRHLWTAIVGVGVIEPNGAGGTTWQVELRAADTTPLFRTAFDATEAALGERPDDLVDAVITIDESGVVVGISLEASEWLQNALLAAGAADWEEQIELTVELQVQDQAVDIEEPCDDATIQIHDAYGPTLTCRADDEVLSARGQRSDEATPVGTPEPG